MNTAEFLQALYGKVDTGFLEVTYIAPDGVALRPRTVVHWRQLPLGYVDPAMPTVHRMNMQGYGCYFGVAVRRNRKYPEQRTAADGRQYTMQYPRGKQEDALYLTAFYADADDKTTDSNLERVRKLNPSIIVRSGGGYHGYMILDTPLLVTDENRDDIKRTLKGIAKAVGSDPHVAELARVLRLPGTVNTKPGRNNAPCEVVETTGLLHSYQDLFLEYAPLVTPRQRIDRFIPPEASSGLPRWVEDYLRTGVTVDRNKKLFVVARTYNDCGIPIQRCKAEAGARAQADGLTTEEIERTINSAYTYTPSLPIDPRIKARMAGNDALLRNRREVQF